MRVRVSYREAIAIWSGVYAFLAWLIAYSIVIRWFG